MWKSGEAPRRRRRTGMGRQQQLQQLQQLLVLGTLCLLVSPCTARAVPCNWQLSAGEPGYVMSPGYPQDYPAHLMCEWLVQAPQSDQRIILNFNPHFEVERTNDCRYDFVEIRDGADDSAPLLGKFCGNIAPPSQTSSGATLFIRFKSDYATQGAGFSLRYEIYKTDECSNTFTTPNGTLQSPGYPEPYGHNLECTYIISAPPQSEIVLRFHVFSLEAEPAAQPDAECRFDRLEVWDGLPHVGPLIGRYCGSKSPGEIKSVSGILSVTFNTDGGIAKDGFSATYRMIQRKIIETVKCNQPLGMESLEIRDEQITASSMYPNKEWMPKQARLNNPVHAWTPAADSNKEWIQADLGYLKILSGIATQGAISKDSKKSYYVTSYKMEVSSNGDDWMMLKEGRMPKVFSANSDASSLVENKFSEPVLTRFVRVRPRSWENGIALRFELYGCHISDYPCSGMLGMLSGRIQDGQLQSSSQRGLNWAPSSARLLSSAYGWAPMPPHGASHPVGEWLQVELGGRHTVRGIILQGAKSGTVPDNRLHVRKFRLATSLDGETWEMISEDDSDLPKLFEGNSNYDTPELRKFEPVVASWVRIYPERQAPGGAGIRMELLGCDSLEPEKNHSDGEAQKEDCEHYGNCSSGLEGSREQDVQTPDDLTFPEDSSNTPDPHSGAFVEGFGCRFGRGLQRGTCGWLQGDDSAADLRWQVGTCHKGPSHDHSSGQGNYAFVEVSERDEQGAARLLSPPVTPHSTYRCLQFWYHMSGGIDSQLSVNVRTQTPMGLQDETLWSLSGEQPASSWQEARAILPQHATPYQVILEGKMGDGHNGCLAVDDVKFNDKIPLMHCLKPFNAFPGVLGLPPGFPGNVEDDTELILDEYDDMYEVKYDNKTSTSWPPDFAAVEQMTPDLQDSRPWMPESGPGGGKSLSKDSTRVTATVPSLGQALDPMLITIITISALGIVMGMVCASLLLYCVCSRARPVSSTTALHTVGNGPTPLDGYNFELYNGVKLSSKTNGQYKQATQA
ncbi:neuropilin-2-like isoform X1 [Petromyzon marinus]|uniref:neuropilin-2-like isoform X1 n=1 Tax=Petromyzon marinus TaxID=7757 RepID=UPI003F712840